MGGIGGEKSENTRGRCGSYRLHSRLGGIEEGLASGLAPGGKLEGVTAFQNRSEERQHGRRRWFIRPARATEQFLGGGITGRHPKTAMQEDPDDLREGGAEGRSIQRASPPAEGLEIPKRQFFGTDGNAGEGGAPDQHDNEANNYGQYDQSENNGGHIPPSGRMVHCLPGGLGNLFYLGEGDHEGQGKGVWTGLLKSKTRLRSGKGRRLGGVFPGFLIYLDLA
jgi:hypothetical protein